MNLSDEQKREIEESRSRSVHTKRPSVSALEELLFEAIPVLDHGFIRVVDYMGDDSAIVQAARVSYGRGTRKIQEDRGLINYLMRHHHTTPFEMAEIKLHVKLPIFVARQWVRHRTANINEYSARYSILDKEFYVPAEPHLAAQSDLNRQGRGTVLEGAEAAHVLKLLRDDAEEVYSHYLEMLNQDESGRTLDDGRTGLARELARMNLSLNFYTQWYWKTDLHNLLGFLRLRADKHAQYEIRIYAEKLLEIVKAWVPLTYEAFQEHRLNGTSLSATAVRALQSALTGRQVTKENSGLSAREWGELVAIFNSLERTK